jgi:hypothetical protein
MDVEKNVSNPGGVAEELNTKAGRDMEENVLNPGRVAEELNMKAGRDVEEKVSNPGGVAKELNTKAGRDLEESRKKNAVAAPHTTSTICKKRSNSSTVKDGADGVAVPSLVAYKKASMLKLQHESWSYDFSAQVPADFKRKGKSRTTRKGKKSCAIADAGDTVSVASSAGENKTVDVVGMEKLLSSEQPVMEQVSNAADAEHISNAEETSSKIPSSELLVDAKSATLRDTVSMTSTMLCDVCL